jgi:hypothetical protein
MESVKPDLGGGLAFITITKSYLLYCLQMDKVKVKYRNKICDDVKCLIEDNLKDFILQAEEQARIVEGQETLRRFE